MYKFLHFYVFSTCKTHSCTYTRDDTLRFSRSKPGPPDPAAKGRPHTRVKWKGNKVSGYTTYDKHGNYRKQFRGDGKTHYDKKNKKKIPRPNVKVWVPRKKPNGEIHRKRHVRKPFKREYPRGY
jgi:hypothetical protein